MKTGNIDTVSNIRDFDNKAVKNDREKLKNEYYTRLAGIPENSPDRLMGNKIDEEYREVVENVVEDMNDIVEKVREHLQFKVHEDTNRLMVQIIDLSTREVLKELPPEEMLDLSARIQEMVGILIDEKV